MSKHVLILLATLALASCSCEKTETALKPYQSAEKTEAQPQEEEQPVPEGEVRVPLSAQITGVQPMTGIVLWTDNSHRTKDYVQMEYTYLHYNDICREKDVFDWSALDKVLADVASRHHQAVIRYYYVYPGKKTTVPDYIKALPDYEETQGKSEGRITSFPDWRCEELQRFHLEFYRQMAQRYDDDPRLAFVETGFGLWAEYHIYDGPFTLGRTFPSMAFQEEFLTAMDGWFQHTPWLISVDAADAKYAPFHTKGALLDLTFGNFDDSFMCEQYDSENYQNWKFFGTGRYKKAPLGGEFSYYKDYDQKHCLDKAGMYGRTFEEMVAKVHMTFIIGNDQPEHQKAARIKEAALSMGYRFEIRDFRVKAGESATLRIANVGVAPIYRDAFVEVEGVRGEYNLRQLMPGQETTVQIACKASVQSVPVIACDHLVPGQKIEYQASVE